MDPGDHACPKVPCHILKPESCSFKLFRRVYTKASLLSMSNSEGMSSGKIKVVGRLSRAAEAKRRMADGQDMLTSMTQMVACTQDIQQRYRSILGPLSLFFQSNPEGEKRAGVWRSKAV